MPYVVVVVVAETAVTDAYFMAHAIILFVVHLLASSLDAVFVPYSVTTRLHRGVAVTTLLWTPPVRTLLFVGAAGGAVAGGLASGWLAVSPLDTVGSGGIWLSLALLSGLPAAAVVSGVVGSGLQAHGRFGLINATRGLRSLFAILCVLVLADQLGVVAAALGLLSGELLRVGILALAHRRLLLPANVDADVQPSAGMPSLWRWLVPHLMATSGASAMALADLAVAAWLTEGAVTVLALGEKVYAAPMVLVTASVCSVSGALWSTHLARQDSMLLLERDYRRTQLTLGRLSTTAALLGCAAVLIGFWLGLLDDVVGSELVVDFAWTVGVFLLAVPATAWTTVATRLMVVLGHTSVLPWLTFAALGLNVLVSGALAWRMGLVGIALGTLLVRMVTAIVHHRMALRAVRGSCGAGARVGLGTVSDGGGEHLVDPLL